MQTKLFLAVGTVAATLFLAAPPANAMTLPAPAGLADAGREANPIEQVRTVCRSYWNGYRWRQRCYRTGPVYRYGYRAYRPYYRYGYRAPYRYHYGYRTW
jgi:hypothetical protein